MHLIKYTALPRGGMRILIRTASNGYVSRKTEDFEITKS